MRISVVCFYQMEPSESEWFESLKFDGTQKVGLHCLCPASGSRQGWTAQIQVQRAAFASRTDLSKHPLNMHIQSKA